MLRTWWARGRILEGVFNYSERYGILQRGEGTIDDFVYHQRSSWSFQEERMEKRRVSR